MLPDCLVPDNLCNSEPQRVILTSAVSRYANVLCARQSSSVSELRGSIAMIVALSYLLCTFLLPFLLPLLHFMSCLAITLILSEVLDLESSLVFVCLRELVIVLICFVSLSPTMLFLLPLLVSPPSSGTTPILDSAPLP